MSDSADIRTMRLALRLAGRALGDVWPNPAVGCVIVAKDGQRILGRGWTQSGGRPHAETEALAQARALGGSDALKGATAYVTLEPCSHHGMTPPCADALVEAGVARVVAACEDSDPRVRGRGFERLRAGKVELTTGVCEAEARALNRGFFLAKEQGRPLVTLKTAASLDGRIALANGKSRWITGEAARACAHLLRARHDAVAVGVRTAISDDPDLTVRVPGMNRPRSPRILFDSKLRLPLGSRLVATARATPVWAIACKGHDAEAAQALSAAGVEILAVAADASGGIDLKAGLEALAERGITRLLVEGGGKLAAGLLKYDLVDELAWFRAPMLLGGDAIPAVAALAIDELAGARRFVRGESVALGEDTLETFRRRD